MVRAAQEIDVPVELVGATGVAGRATAHVRRALANREVETLDERGVQGLGILRLPQRRLQPTRRADPPAPFDSADAIVPPSLEHVTRDARRPQEALNHPNVVLEPLGRDQRESHHASAEDDGVADGRGVSRGAAAEHAPGGATIDFVLSGWRDAATATRLFRKALTDPSHPQPRVINTDQARLYGSAIAGVKKAGILRRRCRHRPVQYLNNIVEQDHRAIKRRVTAKQGFRTFHAARRTIQGYEAMLMIRKGQARWVSGSDGVVA